MKRFLLLLLLFTAVIMVLRRLAGLFSARPQRRHVAPSPLGTELVRDRICNTFLPRDRALTVHASGQVHYFCSDDCRDRFLSGSARQAGAA